MARNVPTLRACKAAILKSTGATDYGYRHSPVDAIHDVTHIANTLSEGRVFEMIGGRGSGTADIVDLFAKGTQAVAAGWVLKKYKQSTRATWAFADDRETPVEKTGSMDSSDEDDLGEDTDGEECEDMNALEGQTRPGVNEDEDEDDEYCL